MSDSETATTLIDPATGMKAGERYRIEPTESGHPFEGFFLDGKYFLEADLLTAVGWLEGQRFVYDQIDGAGEPLFPDRHAGDIADLNLTTVDGSVLALTSLEALSGDEPEDDAQSATATATSAQSEVDSDTDADEPAPEHMAAADDETECPIPRPTNLWLAVVAGLAAGLVAGVTLASSRR